MKKSENWKQNIFALGSKKLLDDYFAKLLNKEQSLFKIDCALYRVPEELRDEMWYQQASICSSRLTSVRKKIAKIKSQHASMDTGWH